MRRLAQSRQVETPPRIGQMRNPPTVQKVVESLEERQKQRVQWTSGDPSSDWASAKPDSTSGNPSSDWQTWEPSADSTSGDPSSNWANATPSTDWSTPNPRADSTEGNPSSDWANANAGTEDWANTGVNDSWAAS